MNCFVIALLVFSTFSQEMLGCVKESEEQEFCAFVKSWEKGCSTQDTNLALIRAACLGYEHMVESLVHIPKIQKGPSLAGVQMAAELTSCPKILMLLMLAPEADKTISANALLRRIVDEAKEIKYAYVLFRLPEGLKPNRDFMLYAFAKAIDLRWVEMIDFLCRQPGYFVMENITNTLKYIASDESLTSISILLINGYQHKLDKYLINLLCTIASEHENESLVNYFLTKVPQHLKPSKKGGFCAYQKAKTARIQNLLAAYHNML